MTQNAPINGNVADFFSFGWDKMKLNFLVFFILVFFLAILDIPLEILEDFDDNHRDAGWVLLELLALGYFLFLLPIFEYGADILFVKGIRGEQLEIKNVAIGFNNYMNIILANLLVFGLVLLALFALIIPGIVVACRLAFVSYLVMDKNLPPIEAVEESWRMTKGDTGFKIFFMGFLSIFICLGGLIFFIVGIFPAVMWIKASFASIYQYVLKEQEADVES